ncbi:hypothetical protein S40285_02391 [Stachybotrys chlorohalonatus IBT 40285]|uniref:lytic cellulose monooxygenase (C4-dehydrogenating) n=1 Tax=Stachybotrys chlorohalonatus (strain IBT 40285) TaxID=1283841 RepID=A0A084QPN5_STAC4|nr:hypothetical protein S40285_02391 [Stachybotrys chlorohalonata IBT 40285]
MRSTVVSVLAMANCVSAHTWLYSAWVNGVDQGDGRSDYIRSPPNNSPVKDLTSPDIVCNVNGATAVPSFVSAAAGDTVALEWYHDNRGDDIIDGSHKGPVITYIAEYTEGDATGPIWTKIAEDGFDGTEWAIDKLKRNGGLAEFTIPSGLAGGQYLIRQEIIAHHESEVSFAENPARGAQFYPACVQFEITGTGSAVPDEAFDFQTGYTYSDPGIVGVNVYGSVSSYEIPGPAVWSGSSSGGSPAPAPPATTAAPTPTATAVPTVTGAPTPTFSTLSTAIVPLPTATTAPTQPEEPVTPPPATCNRKRSLKNKNKKSKAKRVISRVRRSQI